MRQQFFTALSLILFCVSATAQTNPAILEWLQNVTVTGRHYVEGNSTPIDDAVLANVQSVDYSTDWVYATTTGIPEYVTGPFLDGNPFLAEDQNAIYKIPLVPTPNTGTPTETVIEANGVFINGVSLFDYRDGTAWDPNANALCGGPNNPPCPPGALDWNRDGVKAENDGFDCAKGHPADGNYHHHQNPSAFGLDLVVISDVCDTYPSDGLYVIDDASHSPLIAFAYDGYPIYGAYGYANVDGTGGLVRILSSYELDNTATTRTNGPDIDAAYYNGYFREDNLYLSHTEEYYLDEHNGRFAVTPEYPSGIYAYYTSVDENHNSAYPYAIGPTFYGNVTGELVTSIDEPTTNYNNLGVEDFDFSAMNMKLYPNPAQDFITIQSEALPYDLKIELINVLGQVVQRGEILQGSTLSIIEINTLYSGLYFVNLSRGKNSKTYKIIISKYGK